MKYVSGYKFRRAVKLKRIALALSFFAFLSSVGCSQSVDSVSIKRTATSVFSIISSGEIEGTSETPPVSASFDLGTHSFGGNFNRTESSSLSFSLTTGIGVD